MPRRQRGGTQSLLRLAPVLQVHTFVSTCGKTVEGVAQRHSEESTPEGGPGPPRRCPEVLNINTKAQPHIDNNNRWCQHVLGLEKIFVTNSFPFRLNTTVFGITVANAFSMYKYFVNASAFDRFLDFVSDLIFDGTRHARQLMAESGVPRSVGSPGASSSARGAPSKRRPAASPYSPGERRSPRVCSGQHSLMLIREVPGWQGGADARCSVCNDPTSTRWCCAKCSNADRILALHAETCSHGPRVTKRMCLHHHRQAPQKAGCEHAWRHASLSKQGPRGTKRRK